MRVLILGAGGTGGYFGGRMAAAGGEITFLVRPKRATLLRERGLRIVSPRGDLTLTPQLLTTSELAPASGAPFDLILLSCKAYDLDDAIASIRPAVSDTTAIMPLLNGLNHYERLDAEFGAHRVIGGLCQISVTLGHEGEIRHLAGPHGIVYGERDGASTGRIRAIDALFATAGVDARLSGQIQHDLWEKFIFLCTLAAMTCLMRGSVGDILASDDGERLLKRAVAEARSIAAASGYPSREPATQAADTAFSNRASTLTASMLRDLESGLRIEAEHIVGDMVARGRAHGLDTTVLAIAYSHMQTYLHRREVAATPDAASAAESISA